MRTCSGKVCIRHALKVQGFDIGNRRPFKQESDLNGLAFIT